MGRCPTIKKPVDRSEKKFIFFCWFHIKCISLLPKQNYMKNLNKWFGRGFDPQTTMGQIEDFGKDKLKDWKIDPRICCITDGEDDIEDRPKLMCIKLNHRNYNDMVLITLDFDDTYHVRFVSEEENVTHEIEFIYFDQLFEVIDRYINFGVLTKITQEQMN